MMKAAVFQAPDRPLALADIPVPRPGPGELLIRVAACGICGTDTHATQAYPLTPGTVLGHEYAGTVVEVGDRIGPDWRPGDRLTAIGGRFCGQCPACRRGEPFACKEAVLQGFDGRLPGAYAQFALCQADLAFRLPDTVDLRQAAAIEPLAVGLNAWFEAGVAPGSDVLILGAGPIGIALVKWARFFGARTIAVSDLVPGRLARAQAAGATLAIDAAGGADPVAAAGARTGRPPAVIFECIGRPILQRIIETAPDRAQVVAVGTCMEPEPITALAAAMKRLRLSFPLGYGRREFEFTIDCLAQGRLSFEPLVTGTVSLDGLPAMFESLKRPNEHCKVLITP